MTTFVNLCGVVVRPVLLVGLPSRGRLDRDRLVSRFLVCFVVHLLRLRNRDFNSDDVLALEPGFMVGASAVGLYRVWEDAILRLTTQAWNPPQIALAGEPLWVSRCDSAIARPRSSRVLIVNPLWLDVFNCSDK